MKDAVLGRSGLACGNGPLEVVSLASNRLLVAGFQDSREFLFSVAGEGYS